MKRFLSIYYDIDKPHIIYCSMGVCYTKYELKDYDLSIIPEIDNPEAEIKIMTAILWSLKEKKLINQQQINDCIDRLRKIH